MSIDSDEVASFDAPAKWTNRFHASAGPAIMRLAFAEQPSPQSVGRYHSAVIMGKEDAIALRDLLTGVIQKMDLAAAMPSGRPS